MPVPELTNLNIENVYVYVADAVRWDSLPAELRARGLTTKTIAASIHSPASFASIVTGSYPPTHGVTDFESQLPETLRTLFDCDGYNTDFVNTLGPADGHDPIYSVLNQAPDDRSDPFKNVSEPFILMERAQGGHAPYGQHGGTAAEYFETHRNAPIDTLRDSYQKGIRSDAEQFRDRLETLEENGWLSDTLVIYTSDHGELLGEGGMFGHNGPIRPELVYVPTVFVHPRLPAQEVEVPFGHTDILSTVAESLNVFEEVSPEHHDNRTNRRYSFYETEFQLPGFGPQTMRYKSVWNDDGGAVLTETPRWIRAIGALDDLLDSQQRFLTRRRAFIFNLLNSYRARRQQFGSPEFKFNTKTDLETVYTALNTSVEDSVELSEEACNRLHDLGYR